MLPCISISPIETWNYTEFYPMIIKAMLFLVTDLEVEAF